MLLCQIQPPSGFLAKLQLLQQCLFVCISGGVQKQTEDQDQGQIHLLSTLCAAGGSPVLPLQ